MTPETSTRLGRYEIRSKIGEGGMGVVYLARDIQVDRIIALKFLPVEVASNSERMRRFVQEAKEKNSPAGGTLFQMPVLGGAPKKLVEDVASPVTISPDGKQVAFIWKMGTLYEYRFRSPNCLEGVD